MRDYFIFNGVSSLDYNIVTSCSNTFGAPTVSVARKIDIPGKNGTLRIYNNKFDNIVVSYNCAMASGVSGVKLSLDDFRSFLMSSLGYCRLEDSAHPGEYRMGEYLGGLSPKVSSGDRVSGFTLDFNCMPQRFLKDGDIKTTFTSSGVVHNPTRFNAKPLIRVYGTGSITIGGKTIIVNTADVYTDIDCDLQECYKGDVNCNNNVTLVNGEFPVIPPGTQEITFDGFTKVELMARWWTL